MSPELSTYELSLRDLLRIVFKKKAIVATVFILSLSGAFVYLNMIVPSYKTSAKILVSAARKIVAPDYTELDSIRRAQPNVTQGEILKGGVILEGVVRSLQLDQRTDEVEYYPRLKKILQPYIDQIVATVKSTLDSIKSSIFGTKKVKTEMSKFDKAVESLRKNIEVDQVEDSDVFNFYVYDYNPRMASRIANAIVKQFIIFDLEQQILNLETRYGQDHPKVLQMQKAIANIRNANDDVNSADIPESGLATIKIVESAQMPYQPFKPKQKLIYIITVITGLLGGLTLAFATTAVDNTFKNPWEVERMTGISVLSSIPRPKRYKNRLAALGEDLESKEDVFSAYSHVTDQIYMLTREKNIKTIAFADLDDSNNSSTNAFSIAYLLANSYELKTILLDTNFRSPALAQALSVAKPQALAEILTGKTPLNKAEVARFEKLDVLTPGEHSRNPLLFLTCKEMGELIGQLKKNYDVVILHAPNFMKWHDPYIVSRQADGVIVSLRESMIKREIAGNVFNELKKENLPVMGIIFNDRSYPIPDQIYRHV